MGRELKRVPLDFNWPKNEVWKGFINPHQKPCPEDRISCFNGMTAGAMWLSTLADLFSIVARDAKFGEDIRSRGGISPHPWIASMENAPTLHPPSRLDRYAAMRWLVTTPKEDRVIKPTLDFAELYERLSGRELEPLAGSDYRVYRKLVETAGLPENWGVCPVCKGEAIDPAVKAVYEAWTAEEPPTGPGYQVWETVSEGSPISPVFSSPQELIDWLVKDQGYSRKAAEAFSKSGWVMSGVVAGGKMYRDIESAAIMSEE